MNLRYKWYLINQTYSRGPMRGSLAFSEMISNNSTEEIEVFPNFHEAIHMILEEWTTLDSGDRQTLKVIRDNNEPIQRVLEGYGLFLVREDSPWWNCDTLWHTIWDVLSGSMDREFKNQMFDSIKHLLPE